jgi:hypothetical protein
MDLILISPYDICHTPSRVPWDAIPRFPFTPHDFKKKDYPPEWIKWAAIKRNVNHDITP